MKNLTFTCDACSRDITYTGYTAEYRLHLAPALLSQYPEVNAVFSMSLPPGIDTEMHFCNLKCLCDWAESERGALK